jgi:hypothetical protein
VPGDAFDFSAYEARREDREAVAVQLRVCVPSAYVGVSLSCRQIVSPPQEMTETPTGNQVNFEFPSWTTELA